MCTDGLSEARDVHGEFLVLHSLALLLTTEPVDGALDALLQAVRRHFASGRLTDDLAVMLIENAAVPDRQVVGSTEQAEHGRLSVVS